MSGLIKQAEADIAVDRLPSRRPRRAAPPARDPRIDELEAKVAELQHAIAAERRRSEQAISNARAAGRDEARTDDAKRIGLIERGVADAVAAWRDRLAQIDALAATLAAAALTKMFGDSPDLAALTARTLAHHVQRLGTRAIVSVSVSAHDFPDQAALAALRERVGLATAQVAARPDLPTGACRVALRLGEIELDPVSQWAVLADVLRDMGEAP